MNPNDVRKLVAATIDRTKLCFHARKAPNKYGGFHAWCQVIGPYGDVHLDFVPTGDIAVRLATKANLAMAVQ